MIKFKDFLDNLNEQLGMGSGTIRGQAYLNRLKDLKNNPRLKSPSSLPYGAVKEEEEIKKEEPINPQNLPTIPKPNKVKRISVSAERLKALDAYRQARGMGKQNPGSNIDVKG